MAEGFAITWALLTSLLVVGLFFTLSVLSGATGEAPRLSGGWRVGRASRDRYRRDVASKETARLEERVAHRGGARIARDGNADVSLVLKLAPGLRQEDAATLSAWARAGRPARAKSLWTTPWFIAKKLVANPDKAASLTRFYMHLGTQLLDYVGRGTAAGILLVGLLWFVSGGPPQDPAQTLNVVGLASFLAATGALSVWLVRKVDTLLPDRLSALLLVAILTAFFYFMGPQVWR